MPETPIGACVCADQPGGCDPWCVACAGDARCRAVYRDYPDGYDDPNEVAHGYW